jgi:hypothetical protein
MSCLIPQLAMDYKVQDFWIPNDKGGRIMQMVKAAATELRGANITYELIGLGQANDNLLYKATASVEGVLEQLMGGYCNGNQVGDPIVRGQTKK